MASYNFKLVNLLFIPLPHHHYPMVATNDVMPQAPQIPMAALDPVMANPPKVPTGPNVSVKAPVSKSIAAEHVTAQTATPAPNLSTAFLPLTLTTAVEALPTKTFTYGG